MKSGEKKYVESVEGIVRNMIQKQKIDMANEVIDAGRFDMKTTNEQRKQTLENILADENRGNIVMDFVPKDDEINELLAR